MSQKVRIGILGCANIARRYAIRAFQAIPEAEVAAIGSRDRKKALDWSNEFGIKKAGSYDSLINAPDIDALYIPLPIGLHAEWIIKAAEKGKHVISEKSLAANLSDVKRIIAECKKKGVVLFENFMCGYHPQHAAVSELIKQGRIGKPNVFRGYFGFPMMKDDNFRYDQELGGGALNDAGAYTVFMARKYLGEPIAVTANLTIDEKKGIDMKGEVLLEFENSSALLAFNFNSVYQNNYSIWAEKGIVNVNRAYSIPPDLKPEIELITNENLKEQRTLVDVPAANHFNLIFTDFCKTILSMDRKKVDGIYDSILDQARVLEAIRISAVKGMRILLSE